MPTKVELRFLIDINDENVKTKEIQLDRESISFARFIKIVHKAAAELFEEFNEDIDVVVLDG